MLKIRETAVCNLCKVNMTISVLFSVVSCKSGQNAPTIFVSKSQNAPNVAAGELWASQSPLGPSSVSSIALFKGDPLRIC